MKNRTKVRLRALGNAVAEIALTGVIAIGIMCVSGLIALIAEAVLR